MTSASESKTTTSRLFVSAIVPVATAITLGVDQFIPFDMPNGQIGVEFFSDDIGTPVTATAGTVALTASTYVNPQKTDAITSPSITAATPVFKPFSFSAKTVTGTPASIGTATHWRMNLLVRK
jgi:hypothetical protein